jgi:hypothetical protein
MAAVFNFPPTLTFETNLLIFEKQQVNAAGKPSFELNVGSGIEPECDHDHDRDRDRFRFRF